MSALKWWPFHIGFIMLNMQKQIPLLCFCSPAKSCEMPELGAHPNGTNAWNDLGMALMNGRLTALRVWTAPCWITAYVDASDWWLTQITLDNILHNVDSNGIFVNVKFCILIKISLKFVTKGLIDNNPALCLIMAWRRIGDNSLSKPMHTSFIGA